MTKFAQLVIWYHETDPLSIPIMLIF